MGHLRPPVAACTGLPALAGVLLLALAGLGRGAEWSAPKIELPKDLRHPAVACTPQELARLREAFKATGPGHDIVAGTIDRADRALKQPVAFPPRGGQHNAWYQCEACQMGLVTVDDTHHKCPKCSKVYSGEPYDDVVFERLHEANLRNMTAAAWAYAVTGEAKYADFARRVLLGYAERYRAYPYHDSSRRTGEKAGRSGGHLFEQTLNEACSMTHDVAPAFDLVHDALSDDDRKAIADGLLRPMLENIARNKAGKSNWQTWHNAAFIWGGAALGDVAWVRQAVEDPENGFLYQMGVSVSDEGMWYENSWGYHFYTLSAMVQIVEGARRLGIDLWSHPTLKRMFTLPVRYVMADGSLPRFGDDVQTTIAHAIRYMEPAYHAYRDADLAALLPARPSWESVLFGRPVAERAPPEVAGSEVFPGAGHAILRTKGDAGLTAAMTFGPYGGFHGHFDKLSFVFFGHGRELGVDPGRAKSQAYRLPIHANWYKATVGHNAVVVDGASQKPAAGKLERFAAAQTHAAVVARCDAAYPGVRHRRMLCLAPGYLLVVDDLASDEPRRFDWLYHSRAASVGCPVAANETVPADKAQGWAYLANLKAGATDGPVRVEFADKDVTTHLTVAAQGATDVTVGDGPGASVLERVPLAILTRRGKAAQFACVLEPVAKGREPAVTAVEVQAEAGGMRIRIRSGAATDTVTLTSDHQFTVTCGDTIVLTGK